MKQRTHHGNAKRFYPGAIARALAAVFIAGATEVALGQEYPSRPIRFVVPHAAGGSNDILARVIGPLISAALIYSAVAHVGQDGKPHNMSDRSVALTFWAAAAVMFVAFLLAAYFARAYASDYRGRDAVPAEGT